MASQVSTSDRMAGIAPAQQYRVGGAGRQESAARSAPMQEINLGYLIARLWRAKFAVALFVIIVTALVYVFTQVVAEKFNAEAQLLIETQETAFTRPEVEEGRQDTAIDEREVASQAQVLQSRDVAIQVIERLSLGQLSYFDPTRDGIGLVKSIMILLGLSDDPLNLSADERVFRNFEEGLTVFPIPGSRVIVVEYESDDPELSARIVNTMLEVYQQTQRSTQADNTRSASSFLETEIAELRGQVSQAEAAVARYRSGSGLLLGTNNTTLSTQQLSEISTELTRARTEGANARSRADEIRALIAAQGTQVALPDSFSTPLTARLQEEQATQRARIAELSATLLPAHPRIQELNAQLADLGGQIRSEAGRIAQRFENEARVAAARAQALGDQLAAQSAEAARAAEADVELRALEREAAAQRDLLASYLVRFREATTREDAEFLPTNARVIQTAQIQREPIFPKTLPLIVIAFVGSLVLALLAVVSNAILASAVRDEDDGASDWRDDARMGREPHMSPTVQPQGNHGQSAVAASPQASPMMPASATMAPLAAAQRPASQEAQVQSVAPQSYDLTNPTDSRRLFGHIRRIGSSDGAGMRLTVGAAGGHGQAGEAALLLSRAIAQSGRSTVIVDCVGELSDHALCADGPGFYELVTGTASFDEALHKDPETALHIVPSGFVLADRSMIADDAADLIFAALAGSYDSVVVVAGRDPQLLLECATINDCMIMTGNASRINALTQTLSPVISRERMIAVRLGQPMGQTLSAAS